RSGVSVTLPRKCHLGSKSVILAPNTLAGRAATDRSCAMIRGAKTMRTPIALVALAVAALALPSATSAQQTAPECAVAPASRASEAGVPQLLADAECFSEVLASAASSQELRLKKARELVGRPEVTSDDPHAGHAMPPAPLGEWVPSPTLDGAAPLKAEFPVERGLRPAWGSGAIPEIYNAD